MEALALAMKNKASFIEVDITYVFSNSSFNRRVLKLAMKFAWKLFLRKIYLTKQS
jgi:dolichol-phosphate mannosyltransferase